MPRPYHSHMCLLALSLYLLFKDHISRDEVGVATDGFSDFALKVEPLYGTGAMSFNVHQLLYLPKSVAELGPLWSVATGVLIHPTTAASCCDVRAASYPNSTW